MTTDSARIPLRQLRLSLPPRRGRGLPWGGPAGGLGHGLPVAPAGDQALRRGHRGRPPRPRHRRGRVRGDAGALGLRQDDHAADGRRLRGPGRGRDPRRRQAAVVAAEELLPAAGAAQLRHGVPGLRRLAAPLGVRQRRVPAARAQAAEGRDRGTHRGGAAAHQPLRGGKGQPRRPVGRRQAARGARPRARDPSGRHAARRAAVVARSALPRGDALRDQGPAAALRLRDPLRHARPVGGDGAVRPASW